MSGDPDRQAHLTDEERSDLGPTVLRERLNAEREARKAAEGEEDQLHRLYDAAYQRANEAEAQLREAREALEKIRKHAPDRYSRDLARDFLARTETQR